MLLFLFPILRGDSSLLTDAVRISDSAVPKAFNAIKLSIVCAIVVPVELKLKNGGTAEQNVLQDT